MSFFTILIDVFIGEDSDEDSDGAVEIALVNISRGEARVSFLDRDTDYQVPSLFISTLPDTDSKILRRILSQTPSLRNATDYDKRSLLHVVTLTENLACIEVLLNIGVDPNCIDRWGQTPLLLALDRGNEPIAKLLLRHGAVIRKTQEEIAMRLCNFAREEKNLWLLKIFIDNKICSPSIKDYSGQTALDVAKVCKNVAAESYLLRHS
jgi:ankyrin repeat protein